VLTENKNSLKEYIPTVHKRLLGSSQARWYMPVILALGRRDRKLASLRAVLVAG
jgi:hypothetical protein